MVGYERCCGHSDRDSDDVTGMWLRPHIPLDVDGSRVPQLRQVRGNQGRSSNYILPRVVRLTVETNTLTGTSCSRMTCCGLLTLHATKASVAIVSLALYVAFPVGPEVMTFLTADP